MRFLGQLGRHSESLSDRFVMNSFVHLTLTCYKIQTPRGLIRPRGPHFQFLNALEAVEGNVSGFYATKTNFHVSQIAKISKHIDPEIYTHSVNLHPTNPLLALVPHPGYLSLILHDTRQGGNSSPTRRRVHNRIWCEGGSSADHFRSHWLAGLDYKGIICMR